MPGANTADMAAVVSFGTLRGALRARRPLVCQSEGETPPPRTRRRFCDESAAGREAMGDPCTLR